MTTHRFAALLVLAASGCTTRGTPPEILACRLIPYTEAELEACACTPEVEPDGVVTVLAAIAGSYGPLRPVRVVMGGGVVERGTTGPHGELAMVVAIPGRNAAWLTDGIELSVEVDGVLSRVRVRASHESFLELEDGTLREVDDDGRIEGPARFRALRHDGEPRTDTSPIVRVFAANVDAPSTAVVHPTPVLGDTFQASVEGIEHDLVLVGAIHEDGAMSGCWWPDYDTATCPPGERCEGGWGGLGVRRAGCSPRRQRRGECRPEPIDEGTLDAGPPDAGPLDTGPLDAGAPDAMPVDAQPF